MGKPCSEGSVDVPIPMVWTVSIVCPPGLCSLDARRKYQQLTLLVYVKVDPFRVPLFSHSFCLLLLIKRVGFMSDNGGILFAMLIHTFFRKEASRVGNPESIEIPDPGSHVRLSL